MHGVELVLFCTLVGSSALYVLVAVWTLARLVGRRVVVVRRIVGHTDDHVASSAEEVLKQASSQNAGTARQGSDIHSDDDGLGTPLLGGQSAANSPTPLLGERLPSDTSYGAQFRLDGGRPTSARLASAERKEAHFESSALLSARTVASYRTVARPRAPTASELLHKQRQAIKQQQGWVLEAITYVCVLSIVSVQGTLLVYLVRDGALHGNLPAQERFTVQRIAVLVAWVVNLLMMVIEDCRRMPREAPSIGWWPVVWGVELWFMLDHGWRGFYVKQPTTEQLHIPLCAECDVFLPINLALNTVAGVLFIVYICRQYNASDAAVYRDALATMEYPRDSPFKRMMRLLGQDRVLLGTAVLGAIGESGANLAFNVLWGSLIDSINEGDKEAVSTISEGLGVVAMVIGVSVFTSSWCSVMAGARLVLRVQNFAFQSVLRQDLTYLDGEGREEVAAVLNDAAPSLKAGLSLSLVQATEGSITCLVVLVYLFCESWRLTLLSLAGAVVPLLVAACGSRFVDRRAGVLHNSQDQQEQLSHDIVTQAATIKSFTYEESARRRFNEASVNVYTASKRLATAASALDAFNAGSLYGVFVFVFYVGGNMSIDGELRVGFLVSIALLCFQLIDGLSKVSMAVPSLRHSLEASRSVLNLLYRRPTERDGGRQSEGGIVGHLRFNNVWFNFWGQEDKPVLRGLNMSIVAGQTVALVGHAGSGMSTIVKLLQGMYAPTRGAIFVDAQPLSQLDVDWVRRQLGVATKRPGLLPGSIADNIKLGNPFASMAAVKSAAEQVLAAEWIETLPQGYDTQVGHYADESPVALSGGQLQQLALARIVLKSPRIVVLDNAMSYMSEELQDDLFARMRRIFIGRTMILVTPRLSMVESCDQIVMLQKGAAVECGTHAQLVEADGLYQYFTSQPHMSRLQSMSFIGTPGRSLRRRRATSSCGTQSEIEVLNSLEASPLFSDSGTQVDADAS